MIIGALGEDVSWLNRMWSENNPVVVFLLLRAVWIRPVGVDITVWMVLCRHFWRRLQWCSGIGEGWCCSIGKKSNFPCEGEAFNIASRSVSAYFRSSDFISVSSKAE
jgi:hypothetical protein